MATKPKRKTFEVDKLKDTINRRLRADTVSQDEKNGLRIVLEDVLMDTGNYNGYRYLNQYDPSDPDFKQYDRYYY